MHGCKITSWQALYSATYGRSVQTMRRDFGLLGYDAHGEGPQIHESIDEPEEGVSAIAACLVIQSRAQTSAAPLIFQFFLIESKYVLVIVPGPQIRVLPNHQRLAERTVNIGTAASLRGHSCTHLL